MATYLGKVLADGQLPSAKGTLYTVPALTVSFVHNIRLLNTNVATQTIDVYINTSGTSRRYARILLAQNESCDVISHPIQLEAGDLVEAATTTATAVDYIITGVEQA